MPSLADIRQANPGYSDLSDDQLAQGLYKKYYSDIPFDQFAAKIGYTPQQQQPQGTLLGNVGRGMLGAGEIAATGAANLIPRAVNAGIDIGSRALGFGPRPGAFTPLPVGQAGQDVMAAAGKAVAQIPQGSAPPGAPSAIDQIRQQAMGQRSALGDSLVQNAGAVVQDVLDLLPAAGTAVKIARGIASADEIAQGWPMWRRSGFKSPDAAGAYAAGFRNGEGKPWAAAMSGGDARKVLTNSNVDVGNVIARHAAGLSQDVNVEPLTRDSLDAALAGPKSVYNRAFQGLNTAPLGADARVAVAKAAALEDPALAAKLAPARDQLLGGPLSPSAVQDRLSQLRQDGFTNIASDSADSRTLGRAQLKMADALEQHIETNLAPTSGTSIAQLRAARQAYAQNLAVQASMRGEDMDLKALGRAYRSAPDKFSGGLRTAAQFAEDNGEVSGRRIKLDDTSLRATTAKAARDFQVQKPLTYPAVAAITGLPQENLLQGGGREAALRMFPSRPLAAFDPQPMTGLAPPPGQAWGPPTQAQLPFQSQ